jgi:hypothetical protein
MSGGGGNTVVMARRKRSRSTGVPADRARARARFARRVAIVDALMRPVAAVGPVTPRLIRVYGRRLRSLVAGDIAQRRVDETVEKHVYFTHINLGRIPAWKTPCMTPMI